MKNIIISKPVTMVRFSYNNAKDLYGNNGEINNSVMPEFSFCQGFIPLKLTSEEKPMPKRCWEGKGGLSVAVSSSREMFTTQTEGSKRPMEVNIMTGIH